jgi:hypothetical protein
MRVELTPQRQTALETASCLMVAFALQFRSFFRLHCLFTASVPAMVEACEFELGQAALPTLIVAGSAAPQAAIGEHSCTRPS